MEDLRSLTSATNGALSQGPTSPEGKARSARNAEKHGMYSNAVLLHHECPEAFAAHRDGYYQRFQPASGPETDLVDQMIAASWRLRRIAALETAAIDHTIDGQRTELAATYEALDPETRTHLAIEKSAVDSEMLVTYHRFQSSLQRLYDRAHRNLRLLKPGERT